MQTTLLGLAIAFILALIAALIGPFFIDWNQFKPQFEAEATRVVGAPVRVGGGLDARLLPSPSLRLSSITVGGVNDLGRVRAGKLDVEFSLSSLMRGEWRATELTVNGLNLDLGLDAQGRVDLPSSPAGRFNLGSLAVDRLNLTGRVALHDAASRQTLELNDIAFSGDIRSLAGAVRGDGNFTVSGTRYPFRVSSGPTGDGNGTRVHLNIDPGERPLLIDLDGVLTFEARSPRFDGALTLGSPAGQKPKAEDNKTDDKTPPWRLTSKVKADPAAAKFEQMEASFGAEDTALKLTGVGDMRFGASPLLHAALSARQLDADRMMGRDDAAKQPAPLLPVLRRLASGLPQAPLATKLEISAEQIMLGGRPVQNLAADIHGDAAAWSIDHLEFRAPGATRVVLNSAAAQPGASTGFKGALSIDSSDPDTLAAWLQGRSEVVYRSQKPLRLRGDLTVAADRIGIEGLNADIDGAAVAGRVAYSDPAGGSSRIEADVKAEQLNLDAAVVLVRSLGGPQQEWPSEGKISLDIGRATSAGQEMKPFVALFSYSPKAFSLDQFKAGQSSGFMLDGSGAFDRIDATGKLTMNAAASSLDQLTGLIAPVAPAVAGRLKALGSAPGAVSVKLALDLSRDRDHSDRANARAVFDIAGPQLSGTTTFTAAPTLAAIRGIDLDALTRAAITVESKLSSVQGSQLLALLGLDSSIAVGNGPLRFEGSASGAWRAPFRVKAELSGADLDAETQGTAELGSKPKAALTLTVRRANLAPWFGLKSSDPLLQALSLSSRASLADDKLTLEDIDSTVAGARVRGHVALTLGAEKSIDGQLGMDTIDIASALGLALGLHGHDATEPLSGGLLQGWRGQLAFQALRGVLPGGSELRPVSGVVKGGGQAITIDAIKGTIGGGDMTADIDLRPAPSGFALNAHVQLSKVDAAALHYGALNIPAGRTSLRMTLASQGRSASALQGALSGNGLLAIDGARIAGLDPHVFDVAMRASDSGQATDDAKLRQIVEPALSAGPLSIASAQIPFVIRDGRVRMDATTFDADGARAIVSGGYDIAADQIDLRASLASTAMGGSSVRPEIQIFAVGPPDRLDTTIDVASLSSWLAVRAIDRETRRLESLERGEAPAVAVPAAVSPKAALTPPAGAPEQSALQAPVPDLPLDVPVPGRDPRKIVPKPPAPRPAIAPQASHVPLVSQQVAPLPAPIEVRPAPGAARAPKPRHAPPLVLTPVPGNTVRP